MSFSGKPLPFVAGPASAAGSLRSSLNISAPPRSAAQARVSAVLQLERGVVEVRKAHESAAASRWEAQDGQARGGGMGTV